MRWTILRQALGLKCSTWEATASTSRLLLALMSDTAFAASEILADIQQALHLDAY
jgi:hypothetical protein